MRQTPITAAFLACTMLAATPALAITVINQDKGEHNPHGGQG